MLKNAKCKPYRKQNNNVTEKTIVIRYWQKMLIDGTLAIGAYWRLRQLTMENGN